ncbi:MAG TPA: hypothetical protein VMV45_02085 [Casimicrobiaceae bacterium]|nr:hypothetical protein [Casimicrobiaceae bacterium]
MKILLATIARNRRGQPVRSERIVEAESPAVGRGAQCVIHLPDPRVALEHATIFTAQGARRIAGVGTALLVVEGRPEGELVLAPGSRFEIGPYQFVVESPPAGVDLALAYELVRPLPDDLAEIKARSTFSLGDAGVSKRKAAWVLFGMFVLFFLAVPAITSITPPLRKLTAGAALAPDVAWNPGPLSTGHAGLSHDCGACHAVAFLRVRDRSCIACHERTPGHVRDAVLQAKLFAGTRCAECHHDHKGEEPPVPTDPALCVSCHAHLKDILPSTALRDATDFATDHPEFKITLWRGDNVPPARIVQTAKTDLVERSNLKYPHDVHLKPGVRGPKGRVTLECRSCHLPDAAGKSFLPIDMKKHCVDCHTLEFEPAVTARQVPHGSVEEALLTMQEFYANIALSNVAVDTIDTGDIRRGIPKPSAGIVTEEQKKRALAYARAKAEQVGVDLFEKRVCIVCHDVRRTPAPQGRGDVQWTVAPVHLTGIFMPEARFDHSKHRTAKCEECHRVARSKSSADVNLPDIESCRVCHAGHEPAPNKVVSDCVSCHAYHLPGEMRIRPAVPTPATARQ